MFMYHIHMKSGKNANISIFLCEISQKEWLQMVYDWMMQRFPQIETIFTDGKRWIYAIQIFASVKLVQNLNKAIVFIHYFS